MSDQRAVQPSRTLQSWYSDDRDLRAETEVTQAFFRSESRLHVSVDQSQNYKVLTQSYATLKVVNNKRAYIYHPLTQPPGCNLDVAVLDLPLNDYIVPRERYSSA